jgi:acyl-coenzyme A synthetase/AMP-(fatty) acid ligase
VDEAGEIHFAGRLDRQVKRRGYRIELAEIEIALARHPDVVECGVAAALNPEQETLITAFVSARRELSLFEAKQHCAQVLPPYMAPDHIRFTAVLPRGARGKIDYSALQRLAEEYVDGT